MDPDPVIGRRIWSTRRRIVLLAVAVVALLVGPIATYQLTLTAPRSAALLLADVAVGWSMIAAGLIVCDRRPGNRIGPLAVATGFVWFAGDFTSASGAVVAYVAEVFHGWFDPLFAILILAYPTGRLLRPIDRWLALGFIVVQMAWTVAKAYAVRPIAWWDCPTCIGTVDSYIWAQQALDSLGRLETLALTALSLGVLVAVVTRWVSVSGAARRLQTPVVLAGIVLVLGFTGGFLVQTIIPTDARTPAGELRVVILAVLRILVSVGLLIGVLRLQVTREALPAAVVQLGSVPSLGELEGLLRDRLGDPDLQVLRWSRSGSAYVDRDGRGVEPPDPHAARILVPLERHGEHEAAVLLDASLDDPGLAETIAGLVRLSVDATDLREELRIRGGDVGSLPSGEVTFLFGDIEGSTALLEQLGDRYAELLATFRAMVAAVAEQHAGRIVDARADEVFAVFGTADNALTAAIEIQRRMIAQSWPEGSAVHLRSGLHTGHPELTADGYIGLDVHRAARVMAAAPGGRILVSTAVVAALGARPDVTLRPLGRFELRGLTEPVGLVAVEAEGLAADPFLPRAEPFG